jgi:hypothetical protein
MRSFRAIIIDRPPLHPPYISHISLPRVVNFHRPTMKPYHVHLYHIVRSKFEVSAISQLAAIEACDKMEYSEAIETEDAEEITGWLVDEVGDEGYENTRYYHADGVSDGNLKLWFVGINKFPITHLFINARDSVEAETFWHCAHITRGAPDFCHRVPVHDGRAGVVELPRER